jgi:hypothetical protein
MQSALLAQAVHACSTGGVTQVTGTGGGGLPLPVMGWIGTIASVGGVVLAVAAIAVIAVLAMRARRNPAPAVAYVASPVRRGGAQIAPAGARMSPDGLYWWDGAAWRPVG